MFLPPDHSWFFSGSDAQGNPFNIEVQLPMDSADTLHRHNLLPHPYYNCNEHQCSWIGEREWRLSTSFTLTDAHYGRLQQQEEFLILDLSWIDTHATLMLNGHTICTCTNMFDRYVLHISEYINAGNNTLEIILHRADLLGLERANTLPFPIPSAMMNNTIPHMNLVRKSQCHAGWDWGITLMVSGIYQAPAIYTTQGVLPLYLTHQQNFLPDHTVEIEMCVHVRAYKPTTTQIRFSIDTISHTQDYQIERGDHVIRHTCIMKNPKRWYPNGYGAQPLYPMEVHIADHHIAHKIGIRELHWKNQTDSKGTSMTVVVNDIEIFCKGTNWIPADAMPTRQEEQYAPLLHDVVVAHMNMIRVWGGGQYERDSFYALCDQLGILVWQDMMFSCSLYPSEPWFLEEVQKELAHQIRRISHHPCIALYCGDNEVIGALNWYEESKAHIQQYTVNYDRLNRTIHHTINTHDPTRIFWPSSPSDGSIHFGDNWHDDTKGDMHYWDVWHANKPFEAYYEISPRFCSEFGFQSFPSLPTINTFADATQHNITAPAMEHHQKNARGNSIILEMFSRYFRIPSSFELQIYLSQLQQALAVSIGIEYWRSTMPVCMGTLYWQLNDNWPVHSWSSIEYTGRWKLLHYVIQKVYRPILLTARISKQQRDVHASTTQEDMLLITGINEHEEKDIYIQGGIYDFSGNCRIPIEKKYTLAAQGVTELYRESLHSLLDTIQTEQHMDMHTRKTEHFLYVQYFDDDGRCLGDKTLFFLKPKQCNIRPSDIHHTITYDPHTTQYAITLHADKPVFYLSLEQHADKGIFSENCLTLLPHTTEKPHSHTVYFQPRNAVDIHTFKQHIALHCVNDLYV